MALKNHGSPHDPSYTTLDNISKKTTRVGQEVEFDLEVTISEEKGKGAKGSIPVINIGGHLETTIQNRSVNKVKFKIPVIFPKSEYRE